LDKGSILKSIAAYAKKKERCLLIWGFILAAPTTWAIDKDLEKKLNSCHEIKCADLKGQDQIECSKSKGLCYRNAFKERVAIWKELGISKKDKSKVVQSLSESEKKNKELYESLMKEARYVKKILEEIQDLKKEVQSLHPTK
jgi:hypothetical protein|tara:strand:- start:33805 stop:34230 length:426 start_codon:yes stop_codon:yes gene_type:complete